MSISDNLMNVNKNIHSVCMRSGRNASEVTLIGVSKLQSIEKMVEAYNGGLRNFGENYVQEFVSKKRDLPQFQKLDQINWHLIGPLQSNKLKSVVGEASLIHTVDRFSLAEGMSKLAKLKNVTQKILLQVNISGEESKSGVRSTQVKELIERISQLERLSLEGFMTMPPLVNSPEQNRSYFQELRSLLNTANLQNWGGLKPFTFLSMGTSQDYEIAIEEGATHIRVGTTIFGERKQ